MLNRMITPDIIANAHDAAALKMSLAKFKLTGGAPDAVTLTSIENLSYRNFIRLQKVLCDLDDMGHLDKDTLTLAVQRVTYKIPSVPEAKISKHKYTSRKEIKLNDKSAVFLNFGASRKEDGRGGQSIVNKGYKSTDAIDPTLSVKRFCRPDSDHSVAKREAKYLNFFERHAQWYTSNNGPVIVSDWQQGEDLIDFIVTYKTDFSTFTVAQRLKWLASGLTELNKLHAHFRIHADIKPDNFILDIAHDTLHLIDLGSAQKINSTKELAATECYIDMHEGKPRKTGSDMFGMGYVVATLFPELFNMKRMTMMYANIIFETISPYQIHKCKKAGLSNNEKAVTALLDAMIEPAAENRCTSQQALQFCNNLSTMLIAKNDIDDLDLKILLEGSINRNVYEVEDALRGSKRPAMFGAVKVVKPTQVTAPATAMFAPAKKQKVDEDGVNDIHCGMY